MASDNFETAAGSIEGITKNTVQITEKFTAVSGNFEETSVSIKEIAENTSKLTNDNSQLSLLIKELQKVLIDDEKFENIITKLEGTINTVKNNTESFDKTTNKLNDWVIKEHSFKESIDILICRLDEIEKIKDINGEFWGSTKKQMEEGVSIISNASTELRDNLDKISNEFTEQLSETLTSLDELIQRLISNKNSNLKNTSTDSNRKASWDNNNDPPF